MQGLEAGYGGAMAKGVLGGQGEEEKGGVYKWKRNSFKGISGGQKGKGIGGVRSRESQ